MSTLELQQRGLLALIKNRSGVPDDPYLRLVAQSRGLVMMRGIALWWRAFALEAQCRLTTRLLKRLGCFDALVASYFDHNPTSPFVEELSADFLDALQDHADPLVRAVARFEQALLALRAGSADTFEILWDRDPERVAQALATGGELPPPEPDSRYRLRVAGNLPGMMACERETSGPTSCL
jgi:hypothetical protein